MNSFGLKEIIFAGVENILNSKEKEINTLEEEYKKWLDICYKLSRHKSIIGTSEHFPYIGNR